VTKKARGVRSRHYEVPAAVTTRSIGASRDSRRLELRGVVGDVLRQAEGFECPLVKYHLHRAYAVLALSADREVLTGGDN